jgi:hypothetical protein
MTAGSAKRAALWIGAPMVVVDKGGVDEAGRACRSGRAGGVDGATYGTCLINGGARGTSLIDRATHGAGGVDMAVCGVGSGVSGGVDAARGVGKGASGGIGPTRGANNGAR